MRLVGIRCRRAGCRSVAEGERAGFRPIPLLSRIHRIFFGDFDHANPAHETLTEADRWEAPPCLEIVRSKTVAAIGVVAC